MNPSDVKPSYFVEALADTPHWIQARLKFPASLITSGSRDWSEYFADEGTPFVRITNLSRGRLAIKYNDLQSVVVPDGAEGGRAEIRVNDLLLSITAYLGSVGLADKGIQGGHVSQHIALVRIGDSNFDPKWIGYCLLSSLGQEQLAGEAYGGTKVQLSLEDVRNLWFASPPLAVQRRIAAHLDSETRQMDALVVEKEAMLKLLDEKRAAQISHAVTRGLNPRAPLKPSALPWLGDIPKHWDIQRLKFHLNNLEQGWSPQCDNYPAEGEEWGVLKVGAVNSWDFDPSENKRLPDELDPLPEYQIRPRDVLMSRANTTQLLGSTTYVREVSAKLLLCDKLYRLDIVESRLDREFAVAFLRSKPGRFRFEQEATGASNSMQNIGQDTVRNVWLPVPPLEEQRAIVAHLAAERERTAGLEAALRESIHLLQERRRALITAAVTGQIAI